MMLVSLHDAPVARHTRILDAPAAEGIISLAEIDMEMLRYSRAHEAMENQYRHFRNTLWTFNPTRMEHCEIRGLHHRAGRGQAGHVDHDDRVLRAHVPHRLRLYYRNRAQTARFRRVWLWILLSFAFYIPAAVFAGVLPILGMLMLPKAICYLAMLFIFYGAAARDEARLA